MSFEVEGKLFKKFDTESKSEKFQAREFVIETEAKFKKLSELPAAYSAVGSFFIPLS